MNTEKQLLIASYKGYISRVNLRPEVKKNKIIEFIKKQKNIALENEKDFIDCLNDLSLGQHEYLYEFFINLEKFLKKNERKARIYVHNDQICIYIVFRDSESTSDIDAIINEAYNLLRKEISAFINIGEDFEG